MLAIKVYAKCNSIQFLFLGKKNVYDFLESLKNCYSGDNDQRIWYHKKTKINKTILLYLNCVRACCV